MPLEIRHGNPAAKLLAALAGFWILLVWNLAGYWSAIPQYSFGWLVPLLAAALVAARWKDRPPPAAPRHPGIAASLLALAAFALLPTWVLEQPNSDWRLVTWLLAFETLLITCGLIYRVFGLRVLLHFLPPLLFFLTCVPWPFNFEWHVIQGLTRFVIGFSVNILNLIGIGAAQHGNMIEVSSGSLDVTEACSGIRSLQSSFMVSLFLGDFYRLDIPRRFGLVVAGILVALICNIARASFLAFVAARHGMEAGAGWHDSAGLTIMVICFICVWLVALALSGKSPEKPAASPAASWHPAISWRLSASLGLWFVAVLFGTEAWYRQHENKPLLTWTFRWPKEMPGYRQNPIPPSAAELLQFDTGGAAQWQAPDGTGRAAFFLKWNPGASRSRSLARTHRPEICLSASGYTLQADLGLVTLAMAGLDIPFEQYVFEKDGIPVNVFFCLWQDHPRAGRPGLSWSRYAGFLFALHGQRSISQQVLEFAMFGPLSPDQARSQFRSELGALIIK